MLKKAIKTGSSAVGFAGDVNTVRNVKSGSGLRGIYGAAEGVSSAASIGKDFSAFAPKSQQALSKLASASRIVGGAGKFAGMAAKASPVLGVGGMAIQAADVIRNPKATMREVSGVAEKGALDRAAYGFSNPVKAIAGTGGKLAELASLTYNNWKTSKELDRKEADMKSKKQAAINKSYDKMSSNKK